MDLSHHRPPDAFEQLVAPLMLPCEDPLSHGAAEHSAVAPPPPPGCPAWLAGLHTPDGCARTLLTALGRNGEAARRRAAELGSRCLQAQRALCAGAVPSWPLR